MRIQLTFGCGHAHLRAERAIKGSSQPCSAFTLTELVIVVLTIFALGIVALAARPTTGNTTSLAQCLNNVRQIAQANRMYETDYQDYVVYPNRGSYNPGWLYTPNPPGSGPPPLPSVNPVSVYQGGKLWPYIRNMAVYACPTDNTNSPNWTHRPNKLSTYVMNGAVMGFRSSPPLGTPTFKASEFKFSAAVLFWEPPESLATYNDGSGQPSVSEGPSTRHITGCVIGCLDGHSQFLRRSDAYRLMLSGSANELWCNPGSSSGH